VTFFSIPNQVEINQKRMQFCKKFAVDWRCTDKNESEAKGKQDNGAKRSNAKPAFCIEPQWGCAFRHSKIN
jgi:hypothetical protein